MFLRLLNLIGLYTRSQYERAKCTDRIEWSSCAWCGDKDAMHVDCICVPCMKAALRDWYLKS